MTATTHGKEMETVPNGATGHRHAPDGNSFAKVGHIPLKVTGGAGGMRSTVGDLLHWQDALLSGKIISSQGVKAMTTPGVLENGELVPP